MSEDRYKIIKLVGKGRTGSVYEAEDTNLNRKVALRRFIDVDESSHASDSEWKESFSEITQEVSAIQHPSIATVYDTGFDAEGAYVVSQFVQGDSLKNRLQNGPINEWDVYDSVRDILDVLAAAHKRAFHHGAINPTSVARVKRASGGYRTIFVDFGLSHLATTIMGEQLAIDSLAEPTMMAPEQFQENAKITNLTDIYMVGQLAYICLLGGHPYAGMSYEQIAEAHKTSELKSIEEYAVEVSPEFAEWISKLIAKNPADRPQTVEEAMSLLPELQRPIDPAAAAIAAAQLSPLDATGAIKAHSGAVNQATGMQAVSAVTSATQLQSGRMTQTQAVQGMTQTQAVQGMTQTQPVQGLARLQPVGLATQAQTVSSASPLEADAAKGKGLMIAMIAVGVILLGTVIFLIGRNSGGENIDKPENTPNTEVQDNKPNENGVTSANNQDEPFRYTFKLSKQVSISAKGMNVMSVTANHIVLISKDNTKGNWHKKGSIFKDLSPIGEWRNIVKNVDFATYGAKRRAKPLRHSLMVGGPDGIEVGQGYRITGVTPAGSGKVALPITVVTSSSNCTVKVEVNYTEGKKQTNSNHVFDSLPDGAKKVNILKFIMSDLKPSAEFEILVTVVKKLDESKPAFLVLNFAASDIK